MPSRKISPLYARVPAEGTAPSQADAAPAASELLVGCQRGAEPKRTVTEPASWMARCLRWSPDGQVLRAAVVKSRQPGRVRRLAVLDDPDSPPPPW
jgi:hypothetical protein